MSKHTDYSVETKFLDLDKLKNLIEVANILDASVIDYCNKKQHSEFIHFKENDKNNRKIIAFCRDNKKFSEKDHNFNGLETFLENFQYVSPET